MKNKKNHYIPKNSVKKDHKKAEINMETEKKHFQCPQKEYGNKLNPSNQLKLSKSSILNCRNAARFIYREYKCNQNNH